MSAIADKVAAEHVWVRQPDGQYKECRCGVLLAMLPMDDPLTWHVAEVTEAAVRAQIAADIKAKIDEPFAAEDHWWPGLVAAARIAAGGAS